MPLLRRAQSQLNKAVRMPPMCMYPVGLGANRVRTGIVVLRFRWSSDQQHIRRQSAMDSAICPRMLMTQDDR